MGHRRKNQHRSRHHTHPVKSANLAAPPAVAPSDRPETALPQPQPPQEDGETADRPSPDLPL